jgi:hypothetical protein
MSVDDLAKRATRHGLTLCRLDDADPLALQSVVFALRRDAGREVPVGTATDVARLLDALDRQKEAA